MRAIEFKITGLDTAELRYPGKQSRRVLIRQTSRADLAWGFTTEINPGRFIVPDDPLFWLTPLNEWIEMTDYVLHEEMK